MRRTYCICIAYSVLYILAVIMIAPAAFCDESAEYMYGEESFIYESADKRDPFIPLITDSTRFVSGLLGVESIDDIVLEGIVWDPEKGSLAIMNGMILKEHETVSNINIIKIESTSVTLMLDNELYVKYLIKEEGENNHEE